MSNVYNYSDLRSEIEEDVKNGVLELDDFLFVIRREEAIFDNYKPILDYEHNDIPDESFDKMLVSDILSEMKEMSKLRSV